MSLRFIRTKEDFICRNCAFLVKGNGYTNHCPECLWSKHVDISPGDRKEKCGGMMEPVDVIKMRGDYSITHRCVKCGFQKQNKAVKEDNFQMIIQISAENFKNF